MNTCLRCGLALALMLPAFGCAGGAELQEKIDAAAPGDVVTVGPAVYRERIIIRKPLTLVGEGFPAIAGDGTDKTVRIEADRVTLRGFRISGSGLNLSNDDAPREQPNHAQRGRPVVQPMQSQSGHRQRDHAQLHRPALRL